LLTSEKHPDSNRVQQYYSEGDLVTGTILQAKMYFEGGAFELDRAAVLQSSGVFQLTGVVTRKYYSFAGQMVAMAECGPQGCGSLNYFLTDHLDSVVAVANASGTLISQQRYMPSGQVRTDAGSITQTDYEYTGQRIWMHRGTVLRWG
jgi:hypothetical protein